MQQFNQSDFANMQTYFSSGATADYAFRKEKLQTLRKAIGKYESQIMTALFEDLHRSKEEAFTTEIGFVYAEISFALKHLKQWMRKTSVPTPLFLQPSSSSIIREPLGVCLIIAPWNYPFQLLFAPLIGAIAGGNCAVVKPSELAHHTSAVINDLVTEFFETRYIVAVEGEGKELVPKMMNENRFDHVFFTGSIPVGQEIAKLAAEKLVPVTLELGGKSPCIVDEGSNIEVAAKRITWGKFTNAGQTCVAPDYVLVHQKLKTQLIAAIQKSIVAFYGSDPLSSIDYGRIINERRLEKLEDYLSLGSVITGGEVNKNELYLAPTLIDNVPVESPLMNEEIFGPILPLIPFGHRQEALEIISKNNHPLSLYYFGNNRDNEDFFMRNVQFGGGCVNNTLVHLANADLPFGGVGNSGVGAYHGRFSFDTFTRPKAVLKTATWIDPSLKYPPYKGKLKLFRWFFK
jgi:aldehyde dehydrogenase (NAD+)